MVNNDVSVGAHIGWLKFWNTVVCYFQLIYCTMLPLIHSYSCTTSTLPIIASFVV
jgi:hypothetical protein